MKKVLLAGFLAVALVATGVTVAVAHRNGNGNGNKHLSAKLDGFQEIPSISTPAEGKIKLKVNGSSIRYKLSYRDLRANALFAHIHLGNDATNGGVAAFLCGGGGKPACPARAGTVTGTIVAADIQAIANQGLAAGDIGAVIDALKHEAIYANVHTEGPQGFPTGEIRGQIGDDDHDHGHHRGNGNGHKKHDGDDD